jgi:hypothetical protein
MSLALTFPNMEIDGTYQRYLQYKFILKMASGPYKQHRHSDEKKVKSVYDYETSDHNYETGDHDCETGDHSVMMK